MGVSQKIVEGKPRLSPERQCHVQEAERMGTKGTNHSALARRIKRRTERAQMDRAQTKATRALGHPLASLLPTPSKHF